MEGGEGGRPAGGQPRPIFATDGWRKEQGLPPREKPEGKGSPFGKQQKDVFGGPTDKSESLGAERKRANDAEKRATEAETARDLYKGQFEDAQRRAVEAELRAQRAEADLANAASGSPDSSRRIADLTRRAEDAERRLTEAQRHVQGLQQENMRLRAEAAGRSKETGAPPPQDPDFKVLGLLSNALDGLNEEDMRDVVNGIYRAQTRIAHRAGNQERMKALNIANDKIRARFNIAP